MSLSIKKTSVTLLIAVFITIGILGLKSSARHTPSSRGVIGVSGHGMPSSSQMEALKQPNFAAPVSASARRNQQQLATMNNILNKPDVAHPIQIDTQSSLLRRQRRSIVNYDQDFISPLQSLEDEPLMKRQLPDLFAQIRNDKSFEKVLTKLLIDSSLRSALMNNGINNEQEVDNVNWAGNDNGAGRLDQAVDGFVPLLNDLIQSFNQQDSVAKRGSRCAFNAIACKKRKVGGYGQAFI